MKFLVDASVSPQVAQTLNDAGHDALHVVAALSLDATDESIFDHAGHEGRVVVAADTDFADLLAHREAAKPSVILFRRRSRRRPDEQADLVLANLSGFESDLEEGAIVVIEEARIRVRLLPISRPRE